jgi:hypothetical protein
MHDKTEEDYAYWDRVRQASRNWGQLRASRSVERDDVTEREIAAQLEDEPCPE